MRCRLVLAALACLVWPTDGSAQVTLPMALVEVYRANPVLEAARARLRATDEVLPIARAGRRPQMGLTSSVALGRTETERGSQSTRTSRQALGVEQPLYTGGESAARIARAQELIGAERARLELVEQAVLLAAVEAFSAVLLERRVVELAHANERRLAQQLDGVQRRFRFGELTRTDVSQAEARLARGSADREAAIGRLELAAAAYRRIIGDLPPQLVPPAMPADLPSRIEAVLEQVEAHPSIRAARFGVGAARAEVESALAGLKPRLTLRGDAGFVDDPGGTANWQSDLALGAVLSVPLYQGGGEYARIRQSRQGLTEERFNLQAARRDLVEEITAAWQSLLTARARLVALARQVEAAALALDGVQQEAKAGLRTVLDVLDAEQELFVAEVGLAGAERDALVGAFRVKAGMGALTAQALGLETELYDPRHYHREVERAWFARGPAIERETVDGSVDGDATN